MSDEGSRNGWGLGLVLAGATALAIATFLPFDEPVNAFGHIRQNTLIQSGHWWIIGLALGIAASGWTAYRQNRSLWAVTLILGIIGAAVLFALANDDGMRTLYPVGADGTADTSKPGHLAPLGIAIYVAAVGIAAALIGSLALAQRTQQAPVTSSASPKQGIKQCPDCAETVLAAAKVCKHCGYRFPTENMRCANCNHVQQVPVGEQTWQCEECAATQKENDDRIAAAPTAGAAQQQPVSKPVRTEKMRCFNCKHRQAVPINQKTWRCEQCNQKLARKVQ
jgi:hypothetical protein